jgi:hypothetical protein
VLPWNGRLPKKVYGGQASGGSHSVEHPPLPEGHWIHLNFLMFQY